MHFFPHSRPDNLKVLFRPIAMMKPNIAIIAQVTLFAGGFENAKMLATKIATIFNICAELLPPEDFYDFGTSQELIHSFTHRILKQKLSSINRFAKCENCFAFVFQAEV